jgi:protein-S-isoprenylcysteine O-methyltransferase Ste14
MIFISFGCLAFIFLYIFDFNKIIFWHKDLNICFAAGVALLAVTTMGILFSSHKSFEAPVLLELFFGLLSIIALLLTLYSLFFALPFGKTYIDVEKRAPVIDTGMYALCRHPGVIWFFFFYLFLWLASGKIVMMWAGIIWTVMDIIHVYVQDRWLFPKTLNGYEQYKRKIPFLIPSLGSIKKSIATLT